MTWVLTNKGRHVNSGRQEGGLHVVRRGWCKVIWIRFHVTYRRHKQGGNKRREHRYAAHTCLLCGPYLCHLLLGYRGKENIEYLLALAAQRSLTIVLLGVWLLEMYLYLFLFWSRSLPSADTNSSSETLVSCKETKKKINSSYRKLLWTREYKTNFFLLPPEEIVRK